MKTCNKEGCNYNQFGGGFCKSHQYLRTDKKPKAIKPRKTTGELALFKEIWMEREHICDECDEVLTYFSVDWFHHIKGKGKYPELRLVKDNIQMLCFKHHQDKHFGFKTNKITPEDES